MFSCNRQLDGHVKYSNHIAITELTLCKGKSIRVNLIFSYCPVGQFVSMQLTSGHWKKIQPTRDSEEK